MSGDPVLYLSNPPGLAAKISGTGRTPMVENRKPDQADSLGRDHHRRAFSIWMAGGGINGGLSPVIEK